jgi:hypothetical protein
MATKKPKDETRGRGRPAGRNRETYSISIPSELGERAKRAANYHRMTMSDIAEAALTRFVDKLEADHGKPFGVGEQAPGPFDHIK